MSTTAELPSPWTCPTCRETGTDRHDLARKCRCPKMPASPALSPSLAEAAAPMLDRLSEIELAAELPVVPDALTVSVPVGQLRALRAALAVEEWRGKLRLEAAEAIQALPDVIRIAQLDRRVSRWAAITLGREALPDEARADQRQARRDAALAWHGFPDDIRDDLVAKCDWEAIRKLDDWADAELGSTP